MGESGVTDSVSFPAPSATRALPQSGSPVRSTSSTGTPAPPTSPACTPTSSTFRLERPRSPGHAQGARHTSGSQPRRARGVCRGRRDGPHRPVDRGVPDHPAARRKQRVRPRFQQPHPGHRQPARQQEIAVADPAGRPAARPGGLEGRRNDARSRWWDHWLAWLAEGLGGGRPPPINLGSRRPPAPRPGAMPLRPPAAVFRAIPGVVVARETAAHLRVDETEASSASRP
jgi:hypothetical protein